jgi:hypothetical protein
VFCSETLTVLINKKKLPVMKKILLITIAAAVSLSIFAQNGTAVKKDKTSHFLSKNVKTNQNNSGLKSWLSATASTSLNAQGQNAPANVAYTYTDIAVPFNQSVTFTTSDIVNIMGQSAPIKFYKFTLAEAATLNFSSDYDDDYIFFAVFDHEVTDIVTAMNSGDFLMDIENPIFTFEAGTYWLFIMANPFEVTLPFTIQFGINPYEAVFYWDLPYSRTISLGTSAIVTPSDFTQNVVLEPSYPDETLPFADFNFHAEAGHAYSIQIDFNFANDVEAEAFFFLLQENLTQNFEYDIIYDNGGYVEDGNHISIYGIFEAEETENVKLLLSYEFYSPSSLFVGTILITESQPQTAITLPELLNAAPEIQYSALPFVATGVFGANTPLVQGDDDNYNFRETGENFYAVANKINLTAGQTIKIHEHSEGDAYLYVYKKVSGNYVQAYHNDDWSIGWTGLGYESYDSYLEVTDEDEYYIVATNYYTASYIGTGAYFLKIWTTATEPEIPVKTIVSTTPSITAIDIAADITDLEIRVALSTLVSLTATTDEPQTFAIYNNPYGWMQTTYYGSSHAWTYYGLVSGYEYAANCQYAVVSVNHTSGIDEIYTANLKLYPNPAVDYIAVEGLSGSETITVLSIDGKLLTRTNASGSTQTISVTGLQNGIYLLAIQNGGHIEVLKFVKK